jgi:hypothetical protein
MTRGQQIDQRLQRWHVWQKVLGAMLDYYGLTYSNYDEFRAVK